MTILSPIAKSSTASGKGIPGKINLSFVYCPNGEGGGPPGPIDFDTLLKVKHRKNCECCLGQSLNLKGMIEVSQFVSNSQL